MTQECSGPAPPATTSGNSRGSLPRSMVTSRTPCAMLVQATRYMPAAAASTVMPSGAAMFLAMASRAVFASSLMRPPAKKSALEIAEHQIGVGGGRQLAALAVAGRPRRRAGAVRPHAQQAALVDPADGAAAGADGVDVEHRQREAQAVDLAFLDHHRRFLDQRRLEAGAAHVDDDAAVLAMRPRCGEAGDRAAGGT